MIFNCFMHSPRAETSRSLRQPGSNSREFGRAMRISEEYRRAAESRAGKGIEFRERIEGRHRRSATKSHGDQRSFAERRRQA